MKITDPDIIKNGEKDLIDAVKEDIDLDAVNEILKERLAASGLSAKGGEIVVHNNEIAFRIDFDVQLSGSLMFDRQGNYIADEIKPSMDSDDSRSDLETTPEMIEEQTDANDIDDNESLDINLPDYSLDDEESTADNLSNDKIVLGENESPASDDLLEKELEEEFSNNKDLSEPSIVSADTDGLKNNQDLQAEQDDEMDDILKESREFWEQKKDS